jgi:hypothetical protein
MILSDTFNVLQSSEESKVIKELRDDKKHYTGKQPTHVPLNVHPVYL